VPEVYIGKYTGRYRFVQFFSLIGYTVL